MSPAGDRPDLPSPTCGTPTEPASPRSDDPPAPSSSHETRPARPASLLRSTVFLPALLFAVVLTHLPALQGHFLGDDYNLFVGLERRGLVDFALLSQGDDRLLRFWRPLAFSLLELQRRLFGWQPAGYLAVSLVLHLAVVAVLAGLYRRWLPPVAALLASALFAMHPRHLEAAAWISAQPDLWATFFVLLTLRVWPVGPSHDGGRSAGRVFAACLLTASALLMKEVALSLPLLVLWLEHGSWRARLRRSLPLFGVVAVYLGLRLWVLGGIGGYGDEHFRLSPLAPLKTVATFTAAFLVPLHTGPVSDTLTGVLKGQPLLIAALAAGIGLAGLAMVGRLRRAVPSAELAPWQGMAGLFLLSLIPLYNLSVSLSGRADRYLYLPSIGLCGLSGLLLAGVAPSAGRARAMGATLLIVALGGARLDLARSYQRAGALAHTVVEQVIEAAARTSASTVFVAGVPDRLDGIGVLFTGLPKMIEARTGKHVVIPGRVELRGDLEPAVTWRTHSATVIGEAATPALLEGGYRWGGWQPGQTHDRTLKVRLTLPYDPKGMWLVVEADRVRQLDATRER